MRILLRGVLSLIVLATAACGGDGGPTEPTTPDVASVILAPASPGALVPGQTLTLSATAMDAQGEVLAGRAVTWSSSASSVATVSSSGTLTALAAGTAQVTATSEGRSASVGITVDDGGLISPGGGTLTGSNGAVFLEVPSGAVGAPVAVRVAPVADPPAHPRLAEGTVFDLEPSTTEFDGAVTLRIGFGSLPAGVTASHLRLQWWDGADWQPVPSTLHASDQAVSGPITSLGRFALAGVAPVESVTVEPEELELAPGETGQLAATVFGPAGAVLDDRTVEWSTSDSAVAEVSETGLVTAVGGVGPVIITAAVEGQTGTATVVVVETVSFTSLAVSYDHTCGLTPYGQAWCWGSNSRCQLGTGSCGGNLSTVLAAAGGARFTELAAGYRYTCGLDASGAAHCWGSNEQGALGDGTIASTATPNPVSGGHRFDRLVASGYHACGLSQAGAALCWGYNQGAALGDGSTINRTSPTHVQGDHVFVEITVGVLHSCALKADGSAWCWGTSVDGQVGDGTNQTRTSPVEVTGGHVFTQLASGEWHTCGLDGSGQAWCWGWNGRGQLGDGSTLDRSSPVQVDESEAFASIHPSGWSTCGLLESGLAKCWGENNEGTLGNGGTADSSTPVNVSGGHSFISLTDGLGYHYCGIRTDGALLCWGLNEEGQVGDGTFTNRSVPTVIEMPQVQSAFGSVLQQEGDLDPRAPDVVERLRGAGNAKVRARTLLSASSMPTTIPGVDGKQDRDDR